jgi:beta-catenin-like protein 1
MDLGPSLCKRVTTISANYLKPFLWQELTDVDILHESEEGADSLIDALLGQQICALLVQNLERLDEAVKEEAEGVHNTLGGYSTIPEVTQNC